MPLYNIPVLDKSYPLFDWSNYQSSKEALVKDHLVSGFAKETWNAIIDKLLETLTEAGLEWDDKYTSASEAKITEPYGALKAKMFNSVRHNIDFSAPVGWGWSNNIDFRGYVGRDDFKGYSVYGKDCDYFYPEYIIELVRKLNLLIEIMKDTANISDLDVEIQSKTNKLIDLCARPSAPFFYKKVVRSLINENFVAPPSAPIDINAHSDVDVFCNLIARNIKILKCSLLSNIQQNVNLTLPIVKTTRAKSKSETKMFTELIAKVLTAISPLEVSQQTNVFSEMDIWKSLGIAGAGNGRSNFYVDIVNVLPNLVKSHNLSGSLNQSKLVSAESLHLNYAHQNKSNHKCTVIYRDTHKLTINENSNTNNFAIPENIVTAKMSVSNILFSTTSVSLDSAWYPPIWEDDILWIRQTINNRKEGNVLYIDESSDLDAYKNSKTVASGQIDTAWYPPIMENNTLNIVQSYKATQTENQLELI